MKKYLAALTFLIFLLVPATSFATTCQIFSGCTGTSSAPSYGQLLIGGKNGEYEYVASSTLGGSGGGGGGVTSLSAQYPLLTSGATGAITISTVATSSLNLTVSTFLSHNISQWTNDANYITSLAGAASSSLLTDSNTFSGVDLFSNASSNFSGTWQTFSPAHFQTALTLPLSIANGGTATATAPVSQLIYGGNGGVYQSTATSTLSPSSPLTGSFTVVGSSGSLGCQTASGLQAGCLASGDWTTFNNKISSSSLTSIFPFSPTSWGGNPANSTTTAILFNPGIIAASSSLGQAVIGSLTATSSVTNKSVTSALLLNSAAGLEGGYTGSNPCTSGSQAAFSLSATGVITCASVDTFAWPFTATTWGGSPANSTSTVILFSAGEVSASSSVGNLSAGTITATSTFSGAGLTNCNSANSALIWSGGTFGCNSISGGSGAPFPFTPTTWGGNPAVSTSTLVQFLAGETSASSSIGNLTTGVFTATTTATSTITQSALQFGTTTNDAALSVTAWRSYSGSFTNGGLLFIDNGTANAGTGLHVKTAYGAGTTGRLVVFNNTNPNYDAELVYASSSATGQTVVAGVGATTNRGVFKATDTATGNSAANASLFSGDGLQSGAQGYFLDYTVATNSVSNLLTFKNLGTQLDTIAWNGNFSVGSSTPWYAGVFKSINPATPTLALVPSAAQTADIFDRYNTAGAVTDTITAAGNWGIATPTPGSVFSIGSVANFTTPTTTLYSALNSTSGVTTPYASSTKVFTTSLFLDDSGDPFFDNIVSNDTGNTGNHQLKILLNNGDHFLNLGGDLTTSASISFSGTAAFTLNGSVTLPSGTVPAIGNPNTWTALQQFNANASTTQLSVYQKLYVGGNSTTTIDSAGNIVIPSGSSLTNTGVSNGCAQWSSAVLQSVGSNCVALSSFTASFPLSYNSGTGAFTFGGLASSSPWTNGNVAEVSNGNLTSVSTSSYALSSGFSYSGTLGAFVGGTGGTESLIEHHSFTYATSTAWAGTTTIPLEVGYGETWNSIQCYTNTGTLNVQVGYGTASTSLLNASTTIGTFSYGSNNTMTAGNQVKVDLGTPASSPTLVTCTEKDTL